MTKTDKKAKSGLLAQPLKLLCLLLSTGVSAGIVGLTIAAGWLLHESKLTPPVDGIMMSRLSVPMQIFSADNVRLAEFGTEKRAPITYSNECWALLQEDYGEQPSTPDAATETVEEVIQTLADDETAMAAEAEATVSANNETVDDPQTTTTDDSAEAVASSESSNADNSIADNDTAENVVDTSTQSDYCRRRMQLVQAFISAEDQDFFKHPGVDIRGLGRAALKAIESRSATEGASTITMQIPRNVKEYGLSRDQTISRKLQEIILAFRLEAKYNKKQLIERYLNVIYMGNKSYGVVTAAQRYYNKTLNELTLAEMAMLAGLPKAPGRFTPLASSKKYVQRALDRRNYVLGRMYDDGYITEQEKNFHQQQPLTAGTKIIADKEEEETQLSSGYIAEMARLETQAIFGNKAIDYGLNVYTTVDSRLQDIANKAVYKGLLEYDRRHGYRGVEDHLTIDPANPDYPLWKDTLSEHESIRDLIPALITKVDDKSVDIYTLTEETARIEWPQIKWARKFIDASKRGPRLKSAKEFLKVGDIILTRQIPAPEDSGLEPNEDGSPAMIWALSQKPDAQSAFVAVEPKTGAIKAIVGGIEFQPGEDEFNRAAQSKRQPGSAFKPFIYSAALKYGFSPGSIINDAPVVVPGYRPRNSNRKIDGPTRLRDALRLSKNLVAVRLVQAIARDERYTFEFLVKHLERFGFDRNNMRRELGLALGTAELAPLDLATAYTILANDGYRIPSYFIDRIEDREGNLLYSAGGVNRCAWPCRENGYYEEEVEVINIDKATGEADIVAPPLQELIPDEFAAEDTSEATSPTSETPPPVQLSQKTEVKPNYNTRIDTIIQPPRLAPQVIDPRNAFLMKSMMRDVITAGTARKARAIKRADIYGKTGTTNDQRDAWFAGFQPNMVAVVWVGFDKRRYLGRKEYGGDAALPIWVDFMQEAVIDQPVVKLDMPEGVTRVLINRDSGNCTTSLDKRKRNEYFRLEYLPEVCKLVAIEEAEQKKNGDGQATFGSDANDIPMLFRPPEEPPIVIEDETNQLFQPQPQYEQPQYQPREQPSFQ